MAIDTKPKDVQDFGYPRHPKLWFEDGNLVLVASNAVAFRVHRSVVSRHSAVFADMFSFPQPANAGKDTVKGCTVIHLADDPEDVFYFLDGMYNARKYIFSEERRPTWPAVKALLLLGNKYDAEELREEAEQCLKRQYPSDMEAWDKARAQNKHYIIHDEDALPIEIGNLARMLCLPNIHLPALYDCCTLPEDVILHGVGDGGDQRVKLDPTDVAACLKARKGLKSSLETNVQDLFEVTPADIYDDCYCSTPHRCNRVTEDVKYRHEESQTKEIVEKAGYAALDSLDETIKDIWGSACEECVQFYQERYRDSRQVVRDRLPTYFTVSTH